VPPRIIPGSLGGGLLRDSDGRILAMYASNLGYNSNNGAELEGLIRGLDLAKHHGISTLQVEGDSLLIISALIRLREGAHPGKISTHWRLSYGWMQVTRLIQHFQVLITIPSSSKIQLGGGLLGK
jgi:ribonuclease HI